MSTDEHTDDCGAESGRSDDEIADYSWLGTVRVRNGALDDDEIADGNRNPSGSYFNMNGGQGWRVVRPGEGARVFDWSVGRLESL